MVTLQSGTNYGVGAFSNAVVQILDQPFDAWRFTHFNTAELTQANISGPDADPDHDNATNWQEFLGGTDPRDSTSVLRVNSSVLSQDGGAMTRVASFNASISLLVRA